MSRVLVSIDFDLSEGESCSLQLDVGKESLAVEFDEPDEMRLLSDKLLQYAKIWEANMTILAEATDE